MIRNRNSGPAELDRVLAQWARVRPEWDIAPVAVIARLGRIRAYVGRDLEELFGQYGLTRQSGDVLACLHRVAEPYQLLLSQPNREVMRTSGAITHTLRGVEYAGLVARVAHPSDARSAPVRLTEAGLELLARVGPMHVANERRMSAPLTAGEQATLVTLLRKLLVRFEQENPTLRVVPVLGGASQGPHARGSRRPRAGHR